LYRWNKNTETMDCLFEQQAMAVEDIIAEVNRLGQPVIFLGDGADVYRAVLAEKTEAEFSFAPVHMSKQRAASLAACAFVYAKEGKLQTAAEFVPTYLRKSQAEREREEKERAEQA